MTVCFLAAAHVVYPGSVVGFAAEALGKGIPFITMPCVNAAYVQHVQFPRSIEILRGMDVTVLHGDGGFVPNEPGHGRPDGYPWHLVLDAVASAVGGSDSGRA